MGKKCDFSDFEHGTVQKLLICWEFTENGPIRKCPMSRSSLRENDLLIPEVRGEWTDRFELGYSSRRPQWVSLLSATNRKMRRQLTQTHQNWAAEDWKDKPGQNVAKHHESMDPSCLCHQFRLLVWWCGGYFLGGLFSPQYQPSIVQTTAWVAAE